jgi:hypothetical protein
VDNIEMDLEEIEWEGLAGCCKCSNDPSGLIKFREFLDWLRKC